jgi:hypothetical protein
VGLELLIPILMGALLRAAGRAGDGVLDAVQDQARETATGVFARIRSWWSSDPAASRDLESFQSEPEIYSPVIEARLVRKLTEDLPIRAELEHMITGLGPQVEVFQRIATAHGITGAKIDEMTSGNVHVRQDISDANDVTGVDIRKLGPGH